MARLPAAEPASAGFHRMDQAGIAFTNAPPPGRLLENQVRFNGSGVAAGDVDGDGLCDLFFCSLEGRSHLFKNLGNWKFVEITDEAGVACSGLFTSGATFADVNGDGYLDLLVNAYGSGTRLFLNDGHGHFTEKANSGLVQRSGSTSMTLADIDGDGTLDLYVANYSTTTMADQPNTQFTLKNINGKPTLLAVNGVPVQDNPDLQHKYIVDATKGKIREAGEPDILYLNKGDGVFEAQSWTGGRFLDENGAPLTNAPYDWGLSAMFRDMDGDGFPDLYVCNDLFSPDRFWINDGKGHFRAAQRFALSHTSHSSMGLDFADINRDGVDDFLVLDMLSRSNGLRKAQVSGMHAEGFCQTLMDARPQCDGNTLFLGRGDGTFAEIAQLAGLDASEWSWMPIFLDVDLDGYEDVLISTGYIRDSLNADLAAEFVRQKSGRKLSARETLELQDRVFPRHRLANLAFRNRGDLTFEEVSAQWRFNELGISQGMCLADLDGDGDLDVVVNNFEGAPSLYRNESSAPRVAVRLKGLPPNTRGIGAKIQFRGGPVPQSQEMICGGRYLSCDDSERVFAAGTGSGPFSIEVAWRGGRHSLLTNVEPNCIYEIDEAQAALVAKAAKPKQEPLFRDVSELLRHAHTEVSFDDFAREPLLPRKLSEACPAVSWGDLNGDGWPDLLIGGGRAGSLAVFLNDGKGHFRSENVPAPSKQLPSEEAGVVTLASTNGVLVLAAQSNYEAPATNSVLEVRFNATGIQLISGLPPFESCPGPLAVADVDGDGQLDLFVGGRFVPGKYPMPASSMLLRGSATGFIVDSETCALLKNTGLVSGAVFSDLDGDGLPELILACQWGPIRVFHNDHGRFKEWDLPVISTNHTPLPSTLKQLTGWWNGVTTGDFDGDGRIDIAASNWGRNTKYEQHRFAPLKLYYGEWNGPGIIDLLDAYSDPDLKKIVPVKGFDAVRRALPWIQGRFSSYGAYGEASVEEILGDRFAQSASLEATTLESMVFFNRGDHFEARPLPIEAQFAPAFGIIAADFDGDGNEDLFLAQNFSGVDSETARYDAGRGLLLRGDGHGNFTPMSGQVSGIEIPGDQRGAAVCDYDHDGRLDLAVSQNGAATKLYHNERAKPCLRVKLEGPAGNPTGIGAQLRLIYSVTKGPIREVHCGSGYWSQDDATQLLGEQQTATSLWVRWSSGKEVTYPLPSSGKGAKVSVSGKLESE
jgi:hypothetical protein